MGSPSFSPTKARASLILRFQCLCVMIDERQTPKDIRAGLIKRFFQMRQAEATFRGNFWLYSHQRNNLYYLNRLLLRHLLG